MRTTKDLETENRLSALGNAVQTDNSPTTANLGGNCCEARTLRAVYHREVWSAAGNENIGSIGQSD
ncbi:MAG: hypothetical protein ACREMY_29575 [bacterium]